MATDKPETTAAEVHVVEATEPKRPGYNQATGEFVV